jgi:hypothetical protein
MAWFFAGFVALRILGTAFIVMLMARIVIETRNRRYGALGILTRRFAEER